MDQSQIEAKLASVEELAQANSIALANYRAKEMGLYWNMIDKMTPHHANGFGIVQGLMVGVIIGGLLAHFLFK